MPWTILLFGNLSVSGGATREEAPCHPPQDSVTVVADSTRAHTEVPVELLEELDLLMDLEFLEFVDVFGDGDLAALVPEMASGDSASSPADQ